MLSHCTSGGKEAKNFSQDSFTEYHKKIFLLPSPIDKSIAPHFVPNEVLFHLFILHTGNTFRVYCIRGPNNKSG